MIKISVIIPVYNTEKYLNECLDSIVNQTLSDIEIICVNDGSTDNSLAILESYAKKDNRITVISQENNGQGSARNLGLTIAKGKYIYFMDSDDFLKKEALGEVYNICEDKSLDFVMFQLINYDDINDKYYQDNHYNMPQVAELVKDSVFSYNDLGELIFKVAVSPVNKLYNKNFLTKFDINFPDDIIFEDNIFFWNVFLNADKIAFIQKHYYIRRRHFLSTTGKSNIRFLDTIKVHNRVIQIFKEKNLFNDFKCILFNRKINLVYTRFNQVGNDIRPIFFEKMKDDFENMLLDYNGLDKCFNEKSKLIFYNVLEARGYEEAYFSIKNKEIELKNKDIELKNKKLKKNIKSIKKENKDILSSTSWKITKPLRFVRNIFK